MRQNLRLIAAILVFTSVNYYTQAQTVQIKGVVTEEINVKEGKIKIHLPVDIRPGDQITGTVVAEPSGRNEKEKNRNGEALQKYKIDAGGTLIPITGLKQFLKLKIPSTELHINLTDEKSNIINRFPVALTNSSLPQPSTNSIPTHALTGSPLKITGPFDGDASNTKCRIDGKEMEILAESPRLVVCEMPQTTSGPHNITVEENGVTTEMKTSAVNMDMTADKTNLRTGQKAIITTTFSGLQDLPGNASFSISNTSTNTVNLIGGNTQLVTITPSMISAEGGYTQNFTVQSLTTGNFSVMADLNLPEAPGKESYSSGRYIACPAANGLLLAKQECEKLTNLIKHASNTGITSGSGVQTSIKPVQLQTTKQGNLHNFSINTITESVINAVMWSTNSAIEKNNLLKADTVIKGNTSSIQINETSFPKTVNEIQATVYTNNYPVFTLSYPIVINTSSVLYDVSSASVSNLQEESKKAKAKSDSEWAQFLNALKEKERLEREIAKKEKEHERTTTIFNDLEKIDHLLDQLEPMYKDSMKLWLDSLTNLLKKNPSSDINWRERCYRIEQKLIDCQSQASRLNNELNDLNAAIAKMKAERDAAFQAGFQALINAGYRAYGNKNIDDGGNMYPEYGIITVASDRQSGTLHPGVPAAALSAVAQQQNRINALNKQIQDANKKKKEIEDMLKNLPAQCKELENQLQDCRKQEKKSTETYHAQGDYEGELWFLCKKIMNALVQLENWCKANREVCNVTAQLDELGRNCPPANPQQLQQYWNSIKQLIGYKKTIEQRYKNQSESTGSDLQKKVDEMNKQDSLAKAHREKMWEYSDAADKLRKQAEAEAQRIKEESDRIAREKQKKLRTYCAEFLKEQMKKENVSSGLLQLLSDIKDQIEIITKTLSGGVTATNGLAIYNEVKDKKALAKRLTLLKGRLKALKDVMEAGGELLENIKDLSDIIDNIQILMDSKDDALTDAKQFGAVLSSLNIFLKHVVKGFPILELFTSYFSYLVDGYNNAIDSATQIGITIVEREAEELVRMTDCSKMVEEYGRHKNIDDVVKMLMTSFTKALTNNGVKIEPYNKTQLMLFEAELKKATLKKMLDCCLKWVTAGG